MRLVGSGFRLESGPEPTRAQDLFDTGTLPVFVFTRNIVPGIFYRCDISKYPGNILDIDIDISRKYRKTNREL